MAEVVVLKAVHFVGVGVYHEVSAVLPASVQATDKSDQSDTTARFSTNHRSPGQGLILVSVGDVVSGEVDVQQIHHGAIALDGGQTAVLTTCRIDEVELS